MLKQGAFLLYGLPDWGPMLNVLIRVFKFLLRRKDAAMASPERFELQLHKVCVFALQPFNGGDPQLSKESTDRFLALKRALVIDYGSLRSVIFLEKGRKGHGRLEVQSSGPCKAEGTGCRVSI